MRRPLICLVVALFAALVGPRVVGPQNRSAGAPFAYEPPEGFVPAKDSVAEQQGARVWIFEGQGAARREVRVVVTHSDKEMSVEEADLARLAEEMPAAFEGVCTWVQRRHEMRVRTDGARVGLIEGDCDRSVDLGVVGLGSAPLKGRKLQLMFPEDHGTWIATASYPTEDAPRWEPLFEATIGKARGVAVRVPAPPTWVPLVWAVAGAVLAWFASAVRSSGEPGANGMSWISGHGLHGGVPARVRFVREAGGVRLRASGAEARLAELVFDGSGRSTVASTRDGRLRVATVEHLFAALGALSVRDGLVVELDGPEVPLVDGAARVFFDAAAKLAVSASPPVLRVVRAGVIEVGASRYELRPPAHPTEVHVEVEIDFDDHRLERHARWSGDAVDFRERFAGARTFGFEREVEMLLARGLAKHVAPESVVVIARERILSAGPPFAADEPARHKLLDLVGDLYGHGGPPLGSLRAFRPGHAATHEAVRRALADGLLMPTRTR